MIAPGVFGNSQPVPYLKLLGSQLPVSDLGDDGFSVDRVGGIAALAGDVVGVAVFRNSSRDGGLCGGSCILCILGCFAAAAAKKHKQQVQHLTVRQITQHQMQIMFTMLNLLRLTTTNLTLRRMLYDE